MLSSEYGLAALRHRKLKVARLLELNDPFVCLGVDVSDPGHAWALQDTKRWLSDTFGILCFSKTWTNPVLWSHYADRHRGICLGFDVPEEFVREIQYVETRSAVPPEPDVSFTEHVLLTKFVHWRYEEEWRAFVPLDDPASPLNFMEFTDDLVLVDVTIGAQSTITPSEVRSALGVLAPAVVVYAARAASRTFEVERVTAA